MYRQTLNIIINTIIDELGIDANTVNENSKISSDLDVNSLEFLNVIIVLEEEFEITFEEERIKKLKTVGDIANYVEELNKLKRNY